VTALVNVNMFDGDLLLASRPISLQRLDWVAKVRASLLNARSATVLLRNVFNVREAARKGHGRHVDGCSRHTLTPTTCPARPTSSLKPTPRSESASTSEMFSGSSDPVFNATNLKGDGSEFDRLSRLNFSLDVSPSL
jgi:hypothetical protein